MESLYQRKVNKEKEAAEKKTRQPKKRVHKMCIVNRWHLFLRLSMNKELINYRKQSIEKEKIKKEFKIKSFNNKLVFDFSKFKKILNQDFNKINSH